MAEMPTCSTCNKPHWRFTACADAPAPPRLEGYPLKSVPDGYKTSVTSCPPVTATAGSRANGNHSRHPGPEDSPLHARLPAGYGCNHRVHHEHRDNRDGVCRDAVQRLRQPGHRDRLRGVPAQVGVDQHLTVTRAYAGSTAATHASGATVLIQPAFMAVEIIDALNATKDECFPLIYKPVLDTSLSGDGTTYEFTVPNMPSTYGGDSIPIPWLSRIELKENGAWTTALSPTGRSVAAPHRRSASSPRPDRDASHSRLRPRSRTGVLPLTRLTLSGRRTPRGRSSLARQPVYLPRVRLEGSARSGRGMTARQATVSAQA
jgi:hypothetical protein